MDKVLDDLQLDEARSILSFSDDVVVLIVRAAYGLRTLTALANTCCRICALARGSVPVKLHVQDAASARMLLELVASKRPLFSACSGLVAVARDLRTCFRLPGVLSVAAKLANFRALDLTVSAPPTARAAKAAAAGAAGASYSVDESDFREPGLMWPLKRLPQLQQLRLEAPALGTCAAAVLGSLQQLTSLRLTQGEGDRLELDPPDLSPLSSMGRLLELEVDWAYGPQDAAAADGPWALPPALRRLQLEGEAAPWMQHLPGCPQLTELQYKFGGDDDDADHPAAVLELAAGHVPGLCSLMCRCDDVDDNTGPASSWSAPAVELYLSKEERRMPKVQQLTALQHLYAGCCLSLSEASEWHALGQLTALTTLRGIVVYEGPPTLCQHTGVQQLAAVLNDLGGGSAAQVLQAFPAVQQAHLRLCSGSARLQPAAGAGQGWGRSQPVAPALSSLTSLRLQYGTNFGSSTRPAVHAAPILAAARGVVDLVFEAEAGRYHWEGGVPLPMLSPCPSLTRLKFVYSRSAAAHAVVAMVQPLSATLRVLELTYMFNTSPRAVTAVQNVLPHLEHVCFHQCCKMAAEDPSGGTEEEQLAALRQQLRPGLKLTVSP